jgi:hypothetical protein
MDGKGIGTWILYFILAVIAFFILKAVLTMLLHFAMGLISTVITVAIIIGIIYVLYMIFGRKRNAY